MLVAEESCLSVARPAPKRPARMSFPLWIALARATPVDAWRFDEAQGALGDTSPR